MNNAAPAGTVKSQTVPANYQRLEISFQNESSQKRRMNALVMRKISALNNEKWVTVNDRYLDKEQFTKSFERKFTRRVVVKATPTNNGT